jgi:hypothetical protein
MEKVALPSSVASCLWSYDTAQLDTEKDKGLIIRQVLDMGDTAAATWMRSRYSHDEIVDVLYRTPRSSWRSKKSLNFWTMIYGVEPRSQVRVVG